MGNNHIMLNCAMQSTLLCSIFHADRYQFFNMVCSVQAKEIDALRDLAAKKELENTELQRLLR